MKYVIIAIYGSVLLLIVAVALRFLFSGWWKASVVVKPSDDCESCRYDLRQSRQDQRANCPECGKNISSEITEKRLLDKGCLLGVFRCSVIAAIVISLVVILNYLL